MLGRKYLTILKRGLEAYKAHATKVIDHAYSIADSDTGVAKADRVAKVATTEIAAYEAYIAYIKAKAIAETAYRAYIDDIKKP